MIDGTVLSIALATVIFIVAFFWLTKKTNGTSDSQDSAPPTSTLVKPQSMPDRKVTIVYASQKGTSRTLAHKLYSQLMSWRGGDNAIEVPRIVDAKKFDPEQLNKEDIVIFIVSSYTGGTAPEASGNFAMLLQDMVNDFRYDRNHLEKQHVAVFGLGDVAYGENFCKFSKDLSDWLKGLGGNFFVPAVAANEAKTQSLFATFSNDVKRNLEKKLKKWRFEFEHPEEAAAKAAANATGEGVESDSDEEQQESDEEDVEDMEDIAQPGAGEELLYPRLRQSLSKQGYSLIGSHSGVKLCRWTKSMLRGRGGCYKHTFYNISSFQCMEMTPSLACANKCVFCWRHHSNPVATEFKWKMDSPEFLVENAIAAHRGMIKPLKGVEGVKPDRYIEAMNIKHCALSLVGEPIIYPEINKFIDILHEKHISTFMVTNAQFPDKIRDLSPVTQLYVSIDAATPETLKAIDRPLFEDFWERLIASIKELSLKRQRTVYRLTLVGGYNMENVREYCGLVRIGMPDFIEVKGVTYCGTSDASSLTMKNVPYHTEVVAFCKAMGEELGEEYQVACEHAHSCCVLLARKKFKVDGVWHTWIDYDKFYKLIEAGRTNFDALEYAAPTPAWAVHNAPEQGFDPLETKHERKGNKKGMPVIGGC